MGNYNFTKDLKESQKSVNQVMDFLKEIGCSNIEGNNDGKYDISYINRMGDIRTAEVKNDLQWHITGNVAIEYESRGKASGISTSKADCWYYVLDKIYHCSTGDLRVYLIEHWDRFRRVKGGDDNTSKLALLRMDDFLDIFQPI